MSLYYFSKLLKPYKKNQETRIKLKQDAGRMSLTKQFLMFPKSKTTKTEVERGAIEIMGILLIMGASNVLKLNYFKAIFNKIVLILVLSS